MTNQIDADFLAPSTAKTPRHVRSEAGGEGQKAEFAKHLTDADTALPDEAALLNGDPEVPSLTTGIPPASLQDLPSELADAELTLASSQTPEIVIPETNTPETAIAAPETPTIAVDGKPQAEAAETPDPRLAEVETDKLVTAEASEKTLTAEDSTAPKVTAVPTEQSAKGEITAEPKTTATVTDADAALPTSNDKPPASPPETSRIVASDAVEPTLSQGDAQTSAKMATSGATASAETTATPAIASAPSSAQAATPTVTPQAAVAAAPTPTITAPPAEIPAIIAQSLSGVDDQKDRILVQLDPPELGRVSIDFKFDSAGLQHVTITGESPEALRQLRQMHFELLQALERQGLGSQDMTFKQSDPQDNPGAELFASDAKGDAAKNGGMSDGDNPIIRRPTPALNMAGGSGLDIRV